MFVKLLREFLRFVDLIKRERVRSELVSERFVHFDTVDGPLTWHNFLESLKTTDAIQLVIIDIFK